MARMTVITKSFAPDFELCVALNRSVLDNAPNSVQHHIIVPRWDLKLFSRLAGERTFIRCEADFLPRTFIPVPFSKFTVNLGQPFPPVRGWILQQIIKLAAVAASEDNVVVVVDSDVEFVRPFTADMFVRDGNVRFYRRPKEIDGSLPRHMIWHRVARELLGLPPVEPPFTQYISSVVALDPTIVRRMLARITAITGRPWPTAIAGLLHFSEWTLYGMFVDEVTGASSDTFASEDELCLEYWESSPLSLDRAADFIRGVRRTDVAAMISSKSRTALTVREMAFAAIRAAHNTGHRSQEPAEVH